MSYKIKKKEIAYILILNLPWLDALFSKLYYSYFFNFALFFALLYLFKSSNGKSRRYIIALGIVGAGTLILGLSRVSDFVALYSHFIKYINLTLLLMYFSSYKRCVDFYQYIITHIKMMKISIYIPLFLDITFLFFSSGYVYTWLGRLFKGVSSIPHVAAYLMLGSLFALLFLYKKEKKIIYIVLSIVSFGIILLTGARAVVIAALFVGYLYLDAFLEKKKKHSKWIRTIRVITVLAILGVFVLSFAGDDLLNITTIRKFQLRASSNDATAGRTDIWISLYKKYKNDSTILQYLFGHGDDNVYNYNLQSIGNWIWAHNDFVQILVGKGALSLIIFLFFGLKSIILTTRIDRSFNTYFMWLCIFFLACTNGFYSYQMSFYIFPMIIALVIQAEEKLYKHIHLG